jgi:hypothetical protein
MEFLTADELTSLGRRGAALKAFNGTAKVILENERTQLHSSTKHDIFLSHSFLDANVIYGLKCFLEAAGFTVYVYWIEDARHGSEVNPETAERIRNRMKACKALLYATSENADNSKWMPWELGYFDGFREKVAVCPITSSKDFAGREYLSLYPIMEKDLWLHRGSALYKKLGDWLNS